ncbi:MAG: phosphonate ABC transporter, permease protein PhnE [Planctomycetota bacterium]|nr:MAG: phosphonate ABC transporter, permease protein PhnE [Planctomycetota bacterium]
MIKLDPITLETIWRPTSWRQRLQRWGVWLFITIVILISWRAIARETIWDFVWDAHSQAAQLTARMIPPNFAITGSLLRPLWDTINIATLGTLLGLVIATPLAFLAAKNTTPHIVVRQIALFFIVSSRSVASLIWALLFVSIVGPGILAGILAIGVRSVGFIAKLLYEAIEEIDPSQVEAIRATGASQAQVMAFGFVPQVLPAYVGINVFRWDINIRESTVLGLVGAGGIGLNLDAAVNTMAWDNAATIFVAIFILVIFSELVSAKVRKKFI